jgi:hypothetical protein
MAWVSIDILGRVTRPVPAQNRLMFSETMPASTPITTLAQVSTPEIYSGGIPEPQDS